MHQDADPQAPRTLHVRDIGSFHIGGREAHLSGLPAREVVFSPGNPPVRVDPNGSFEIEQMYVQHVRLAAPRAPAAAADARWRPVRRVLGDHARRAARLAAALAPELGLIISKGGITTHTLLADGLDLGWVELQGQLLPGLSLVLTPPEAAVPGLPVVTFPGNLGDAGTLRQAWRLLTQR